MLAVNVTQDDLNTALELTNKLFSGNIAFKSLTYISKNRIRFTLKCVSFKEPGHRLHIKYDDPFGKCVQKNKRSSYACWHVHGYFFDMLFMVNPNAKVKSGSLIHAGVNKGWITKDQGNWEDTNIGSQMFPLYFSESCDCDMDILTYCGKGGY